MKRKILFAVVSVILLFLCVFTIALCSNKPNKDINSSNSSDVTSTNIDSSDGISLDEPDSSEDISLDEPVSSEDISLDEPDSSDDPVNSEIEDDIYHTITFKDYDGTVLQISSVKEGETPTYNKATPTRDNDDNYSYAFSGWSPSISEVNADAIYTATYTSTIRQYNITFVDDDGTTPIKNTIKYNYGTSVDDMDIPANPTKPADNTYTYTFLGWSPALANVTKDVTYRATYTATYIDYLLTLNKNIDNAGTVTGAGTYHFNDSLTITAETNDGYTFNGWYDGETLVSNELSYTFNMPATNKSYEARWTANTYTVALSKNINNAGTVTGAGTYHFNDSLTITATTNPGYTFNGWYDGGTLVSNELSYTFNMLAANKSYEARWTANTNTAYKVEHYWQNVENDDYTSHETDNLTGTTNTSTNAVAKTYTGFASPTSVEQININGDGSTVVKLYYTRNTYTVALSKNIDSAGSIDGAETYKYGAEVTISATTNPGYTFMGWYDGETLVYSDASKTFVMPAEDITYTAKYINYKKDGNKVYFGTYPQTKIEATNENGLSSITFDSNTWTSYKYYVESTQSDYMYYKDVDINNDGINDYRGVYFTQYRPSRYSLESSTDKSYQDDNGYFIDTIYWFSYDPIEWNILKEEENGKALILANLILDSQEYYPTDQTSEFEHNGGNGYGNNYELSEIRKFLNEDFYNTAFIDLEKDLIQTTTVDNSASSTSNSSNSFACVDTEDNMFLLSYSEATNSDYGFTNNSARQAQGSDYAKCQGLYAYTNNNSMWWLRSPLYFNPACAYRVTVDGIYESSIDYTDLGVRPACWINLL